MSVVLREAATADEILARASRLDDEAVRRILVILAELLERVRGQIAARPELAASDLEPLRREIEQIVLLYRGRLVTELNGELARAFDLGDDAVDAMAWDAGVPFGIASVSTRTLEIAQAYVADLITGITEQMRYEISREIRLAALGGRSLAELMTAIGRNLDGPGVFGRIATRAEAIARTEVLRVYSLSFRARGDQLAQVVPGLRKRWVHAGPRRLPARVRPGQYRPRPDHVALHGQTIPWEELFVVGGERAFGPHDPRLSARQSVNCKCRLELVFPEEA
jgi:hypothetical protein